MFNLSAKRLIIILFLLFVLLIALPIVTHLNLPQIERPNLAQITVDHDDGQHLKIDENDLIEEDCDSVCFKLNQMKIRLKQLIAIKKSVTSELKTLEEKRRNLIDELTSTGNKLDDIKSQFSKKTMELERVHKSLEQAKQTHREETDLILKSGHLIAPPLQLELIPSHAQQSKGQGLNGQASNDQSIIDQESHVHGTEVFQCNMNDCFNYSRCSVASKFLVYFYQDKNHHSNDKKRDSNDNFNSIVNSINSNTHVITDPKAACMYLVLYKNNLTDLKSLPYWSDGLNHLIINSNSNSTSSITHGKAIIAQINFHRQDFRHNYDVVIPNFDNHNDNDNFIPISHCPARRKYLISYRMADYCHGECRRIAGLLNPMNEQLKYEFNCSSSSSASSNSGCENHELILGQSTFALIISTSDLVFSEDLSILLKKMLRTGAIPVIVSLSHFKLPFTEVIDWRRATIQLPVARITELHWIIQSYSDADILSMRRFGQMVYQRYFISHKAVIDTILSLVRQRLLIPPPAAQQVMGQHLYNETLQTTEVILNEEDEFLGPIEAPFPSLTYQRNYSSVINFPYELWNDIRFDPFYNYPSTPFDGVLPSEAKFIGSSYGFRPIGQGAGGSGKEFSEALGGNQAKEQFTIVMLTYEREAVLIDSLSKLKGIPYLNKVLVIWNSPDQLPSADLRWPDIGVQIEVLKAEKNSLNNRFLPFQQIETDAILSMDDDAHLRHDEIVFGFR